MQRAKELVSYFAGEYAMRSAPDWVIKCIMAIDKDNWNQIGKYAQRAQAILREAEDNKTQQYRVLVEKNDTIERLEMELDMQTKARREAEALYASAKSEAVAKMSAIETAEGMAAAAIADMADMRQTLEKERYNSRRLNSERSKKTYNLKQDLLSVKKELRGERRTRKDKERDVFVLSSQYKDLVTQRNALNDQILEIEEVWKHQRNYLVSQVSNLRTTLAASGLDPSRCPSCGTAVTHAVRTGEHASQPAREAKKARQEAAVSEDSDAPVKAPWQFAAKRDERNKAIPLSMRGSKTRTTPGRPPTSHHQSASALELHQRREQELANIEEELSTERDKAMLGWTSPQPAWEDENIEKEVITPVRPLRPYEPKDPSVPSVRKKSSKMKSVEL